jgi:hypothetical protein
MYYHIYPAIDATIYQRYPERNTGIDQILEITKLSANQPYGLYTPTTNQNSRALIKFSLNEISASIVAGTIPTSAKYFLRLWNAEGEELAYEYTLNAHPVSQSWFVGYGAYNDSPENRGGVSWTYRDGSSIATPWSSSGADWYTQYAASQSFSYEVPDVNMDVTSIVNNWLNNTVPNQGFIVKHTAAAEASNEVLGSLKFYSKETNTIYVPRLEIKWDDSDLSGTGSFSEISDISTSILYVKNLLPDYRETSIAKIRLSVRPEFPVRTYATSSTYLTEYRLPTSSYYAVYDVVTNEAVIPYDTNYTKVSCDTNGNFLTLRMNAFMPDRFYRISFKAEQSGNVTIYDNGYTFKVIK